MKTIESKPKNIDEYILGFPEELRIVLQKIRETIQKAAPEARETISYQMPAFTFKGVLIYFAACKKHIGFYPTSSGVAAFKDELSDYKTSKGAIQFPLDKPIPYDLIAKITAFRVNENLEKEALKKKKSS